MTAAQKLSQNDSDFIMEAIRIWRMKTNAPGEDEDYFGEAWEAWTNGRRAGRDGDDLRNLLIWRLKDAVRGFTSRSEGQVEAATSSFEVGGRFTRLNPILGQLRDEAIERFPLIRPVLEGRIPLNELKNVNRASMRTISYLRNVGQGNVLSGRKIVLDIICRLRERRD